MTHVVMYCVFRPNTKANYSGPHLRGDSLIKHSDSCVSAIVVMLKIPTQISNPMINPAAREVYRLPLEPCW